MTRPSERLARLGLTLPEVPVPLAAYVPAVRVGDLVFSAGQLPSVDGNLVATGRLGAELDVAQGAAAARVAALNALAAVASAAGALDAVTVVKVTVFVAGTPEFTDQPEVANGASALIEAVFGAAGRHARSSVGVASLPRNAAVEVEMVAYVHAVAGYEAH